MKHLIIMLTIVITASQITGVDAQTASASTLKRTTTRLMAKEGDSLGLRQSHKGR